MQNITATNLSIPDLSPDHPVIPPFFQITSSNNELGEFPTEDVFGAEFLKQNLSGNQGRIVEVAGEKMMYFGGGFYDGRLYYIYPEPQVFNNFSLKMTYHLVKNNSDQNPISAPFFRIMSNQSGAIPIVGLLRTWPAGSESPQIQITMRGNISVNVPISFNTTHTLHIQKNKAIVSIYNDDVLIGNYTSIDQTFTLTTVDLRTASHNGVVDMHIGDFILTS